MAGRKRANAATERAGFTALLADVKGRIQAARTRAVLAVNSELVRLYWDIGRIIDERQQREGWGSAVIPRLALRLKNELPELKGFSERNLGLMIAFARQYPQPDSFLQPPVAQRHRARSMHAVDAVGPHGPVQRRTRPLELPGADERAVDSLGGLRVARDHGREQHRGERKQGIDHPRAATALPRGCRSLQCLGESAWIPAPGGAWAAPDDGRRATNRYSAGDATSIAAASNAPATTSIT